jgi:hypothetical protein
MIENYSRNEINRKGNQKMRLLSRLEFIKNPFYVKTTFKRGLFVDYNI